MCLGPDNGRMQRAAVSAVAFAVLVVMATSPSLAAGKRNEHRIAVPATPVLRGTSPGAPLEQPAQTKPAPAKPGTGWSAADIVASRKECEVLLKGLALDFSYAAPIRHNACGAAQPIVLRSIGAKPAVAIDPPATLNCHMAAKLANWMMSSVQPLAATWLKSKVVSIKNEADYDCRNRYGDPGQKLSEHAKANAIDIGAFTFQSGTGATVGDNWGPVMRDLIAAAKITKTATAKTGFAAKVASADGSIIVDPPLTGSLPVLSAEAAERKHLGSSVVRQARRDEAKALGVEPPKPQTAAANFIHAVHDSACQMFGTVLGPEANDAHRQHFHFDLAPRAGSSFCE